MRLCIYFLVSILLGDFIFEFFSKHNIYINEYKYEDLIKLNRAIEIINKKRKNEESGISEEK